MNASRSTSRVRGLRRWRGAGVALLVGIMAGWGIVGCGKKPAGAAPAPTNAPPKAVTPGAPAPGVVAVPTEPEGSKSLFEDRPGTRDPFYPVSERRILKAQNVVDPAAAAKAQADVTMTNLVVKTIIMGTTRRAWINNRSFTVGETDEIKMPDGKRIKVNCVDIREKVVIVEIEGLAGKKELPLRTR